MTFWSAGRHAAAPTPSGQFKQVGKLARASKRKLRPARAKLEIRIPAAK
jgi:hypothetical protein